MIQPGSAEALAWGRGCGDNGGQRGGLGYEQATEREGRSRPPGVEPRLDARSCQHPGHRLPDPGRAMIIVHARQGGGRAGDDALDSIGWAGRGDPGRRAVDRPRRADPGRGPRVERHLGIEIPTREEMADIEPSEILYRRTAPAT